ncbi:MULTISPECIES: histidine kinase N-terminal 7TM domain-containing diguanylate cyclase [Cohnella]|uniref:histidine kinase N-terminal 7TM domain-containing diguanylate cyclase n=1 Tax=Cohnella TaxID=329857 RepID=UPI00047810F6|nr:MULTISPECIES: diguanylate cyclase [Cohnella]
MGLLRPDFVLFVCLFAMLVGVIAFSRITRTHKAYLAFHFVLMLWPFGQFSARMTDLLEYKMFYCKLSFVGIGMLGPGWLFFVLILTQLASRLNALRAALYMTPALASIAVMIWNPGNAFLNLADEQGGREYGFLFWLFVFVQLCYLSVTLVVMFHSFRHTRSIHQRKQLGIALLGMFIMSGFTVVDLLVNVLLNKWLAVIPGITSAGILFSCGCFVLAIYRYGLSDTLSMAQRDIIEHMPMGIVVVDEHGKVLAANKAAGLFVQVRQGDTFSIEQFLAPLQPQSEAKEFLYRYRYHPAEKAQTELSFPDDTGRYISIQMSPVIGSMNSVLGRVITFHEVTELRKLVDEMNRKNEALHERNLELITVQEELFRLNQKLEQMAITDSLTGCYNRRFLMQQLEHEVLRNMRHRIPFSIFLFDIDHFKQINDRFGHLVGDEVICRTADAVRSVLRRSDILARYGGEEFTIYLPHTNAEQAEALASRIMQAVENNVIETGNMQVKITISMGIVSEDPAESKEDVKEYLRDLFHRADSALYQAKHEGRNRVVASQSI